MANLCNACQSLCSTAEAIEVLCSENGSRAHDNIEHLLESAKNGCGFCSMLVDSKYSSDSTTFPMVLDRLSIKVKLSGQLNRDGILDRLWFYASIYSFRPGGKESWTEYKAFKIDVASVGDRREDQHFNSPEAAKAINRWMGCCAEHENCLHNTKPILPKRVLAVGTTGDESLKVLESDSLRARYAILSYCWGGEQDIITNKSNLCTHAEHLDVSSLSQTIQDAISVTRNIGLEYLWVDALCIIQNDSEDKMLEISEMHNYYKNGSLTIIAAGAAHAKDGFLKPQVRPECDLPYLTSATVATITYNTIDTGENDTGNRHMGIPFTDVAAKVRSPIYNRAWTLEERLLSRRRLQFGLTQIEWECQESSSVFKQTREGKMLLMDDTVVTTTQNPPAFDYFAKNYSPSFGTILVSWAKAVEEYTSRHLTKPEDKLPAIGAIAHEFNRVTKKTYLAGLWKESIYMDLLWYLDRSRNEFYEPKIAAVSPYRAPSWSWASLDGRVKAGTIYGEYRMEADLHASRIELKSSKAPFGQVKRGFYLEFDACVKQVPILDREKGAYGPRFPLYYDKYGGDFIRFDLEPEENWNACEAWFMWLCTKDFEEERGYKPKGDNDADENSDWETDSDANNSTGFPVSASNTARKEKKESEDEDEDEEEDSSEESEEERRPTRFDEAIGLIVVPSGNAYSNDFRRIGTFCATPPAWFDGTPKSRIRLV